MAPRTTMGVGGLAQRILQVERESDAIEALRWATEQRLPLRILGGGSNVVVADGGVDGLVLALATRGTTIQRSDERVLVTAKAGEPWDAFVAYCVAEGFAGLECLSGVPGAVGATPIQNVGAYGQDVSEALVSVEVYDRAQSSMRRFDSAACGFGYRDSTFKRDKDQRYVVLSATFSLKPGGTPRLNYSQLRVALPEGEVPTLAGVRERVLTLRRQKSMVYDAQDPHSRGCGSFFTNPVVSSEHLAIVRRAANAAPPQWELPGGSFKLSAAWLIERAGYPRGTRRGAVGLSPHHSLAIVNYGEASAAEVVAFAREVQRAVQERFRLALEPEPSFWGFSAFECGLPLL